jgi:hypothetical protein
VAGDAGGRHGRGETWRGRGFVRGRAGRDVAAGTVGTPVATWALKVVGGPVQTVMGCVVRLGQAWLLFFQILDYFSKVLTSKFPNTT